MPGPDALLHLRVLLELLLHEVKGETKKHLMAQLHAAAAAAASSGSGGAAGKPDAAIARPLKQVKAAIKALHAMQLAADFPRQLLAAGDLSALWANASCGSSLAAAAGEAGPDLPPPPASSFAAALVAACMQQLDRMPAELPLLALQLLWDGRALLRRQGLLAAGLPLLRAQEEACVSTYMQQLVPAAAEHFKVRSAQLARCAACCCLHVLRKCTVLCSPCHCCCCCRDRTRRCCCAAAGGAPNHHAGAAAELRRASPAAGAVLLL